MDITQLSGVSSDYLNTFAKKEALVPGDDDSFSAVLSTAMKSVDETNDHVDFRLPQVRTVLLPTPRYFADHWFHLLISSLLKAPR